MFVLNERNFQQNAIAWLEPYKKNGNELWEKKRNGMVKGRLKQTNPQSHAMNQAEKLMAEKVIR